MDNTTIQFDGYGVPFPPEKQQAHLAAVLYALYKPVEEDKTPIIEPEWKDKPAGQYEKRSEV